MKIAIHAADLDRDRVDGTRVYILNMLRQFGKISSDDDFFVYHKEKFNPELTPPNFENYQTRALGKFPLWTHTKFAWEIFKTKPEVLWLGLHNLPIFRRKNLKTVVTIHDLAFKLFPEHFTKKDLFKLNSAADRAIKNSTKIIAVSNSTKNDILKLYPEIKAEKITVIHHGFTAELFSQKISQQEAEPTLKKYDLKPKSYLLYVGAIQPRKNLNALVSAFEKIKKTDPEPKLVLAGEKAWMWEDTLNRIQLSPFASDIIVTGKVPFSQLPSLYQNAAVFVFPTLYEGFGIPVLEAFASGVPVILANNSSLPEVAGDAALFFEGGDSDDLTQKIEKILGDSKLKEEMIKRGTERLKEFSWEKCAKLTLDTINK